MNDRNSESFFENNIYNTIEIAELAEDVECNPDTINSGVDGKFYIKILTPSQDVSNLKSKQLSDGSSITNYLILHIPQHLVLAFCKFKLNQLYIQNHVLTDVDGTAIFVLGLENNKFIIPKGTKFLFTFYSGELEYDRIKLIGIY